MPSNINLHIIDIAIILSYLALCLIIGLRKYDTVKTMRDYTLGTRPFSTGVLIATIFATTIGAGHVVGYSGKVYTLGLVFAIPILFDPICWVIMSKLFASHLEYCHKKKFMSLGDIMEDWYGKSGRWVTNICAVFLGVGVIAMGIVAMGYLLHYFLHIPEMWGMIAGVSIITAYSAFGGIRAVAFTDVFQFLIFFFIIPVACAIGLSKVGGIQNVITSLPSTHLTIDSKNLPLFLSFLLYALVPNTAIPYIQRALLARNTQQFKKAFFSVALLMFPLLIAILTIGLIVHTMDPNVNANAVLYYFIDHNSPSIIKGLMIAGVLAVIMSTLDSYLNTTSALIARDICKQLFPKLKDKQELAIARVACVSLALMSTLIVLIKKDVLDIAWLIANFWEGLITIPFVAGLLGARISRNAFHILTVSVIITESITRYVTGSFDTISFMVGTAVSTSIIFVANRLYKKQHPEISLNQPVKQQPVLIGLKTTVAQNNFSLSSLYLISIVVGCNYGASMFFLDLTTYSLVNYACGFAAFFCVLLVINELWDWYLRAYVPQVWSFTLFFCLILVPVYFVFLSHYKFLWIVNLGFSATLFYLLTNPIRTFTSLAACIAANGIGFIIFPHVSEALNSTPFAICSCFFTIIAITINTYKQHYISKEVFKEVSETLEEKVAQRTEELKHALAVKKEFLSKVGHEVRTPLHGIGLATELYKEWDAIPIEKRRGYIKVIADSTDRLLKYAKNIMDLARYDSGKMTLTLKQYINLEAVGRWSIHNAESKILSENKDLKIKFETLGELRKPIVECDPDKIEELFSNLLDNAIKYSHSGKITFKIESSTKEVTIFVIDEGVGVPDDEKHLIFDDFTESSRTKTMAKGTGLGLSIAREVVSLHGGKIWVENNTPHGSKFIIILPYWQEQHKENNLMQDKEMVLS